MAPSSAGPVGVSPNGLCAGLYASSEASNASADAGRADPALVERYSRGRRAKEHIDLLERVIVGGATGIAGASPRPS